MKLNSLDSCPLIGATLRQVGRLACGLVALLAFTLPVQAVELLYATMNDNTVATFDVSSGNATTIANSILTFASGFVTPQGLAFDSAGNLYVSNRGDTTISKVTPGGSVSTFVSSGLNSPVGLTFDSSGNLYATNNINNTISKIDSTGTILTSFSTGAAAPRFLAFAPTPVPEPSTYALAAIAAGVMGVLARRRNARKSA